MELPNVEITGRSESCVKGNSQVCEFLCDTDIFLPKPVVRHLKFKVGYLTVTLRRSFISLNVEYVEKVLTLVRQKRNSEQDLVIIKAHIIKLLFATTLRVLKPVLCFHMTPFNYDASQGGKGC